MRLYNKKVHCVNCGKAAKKHTKSYYSNKPYQGNLKILRNKSWFLPEVNGGETQYDLSLWDGESYELYAGKFCTNRCAIEWANRLACEPNP